MKKIIQYIIFIHRYFFPQKDNDASKESLEKAHESEATGTPVKVSDVPPATSEPPPKPSRPFGEVISDAEHLMSQKLFKEALALFRQLDKDLMGTGELMKIQFVRERIEALLTRVKASPSPASEEIIHEEDMADVKEFDATIFEADNYFEHKLLNEALFLYRKLEKKWSDKDDPQRKAIVTMKINAVLENMDDPYEDVLPEQIEEEPEKPVPVVYLDQDGLLTGQKPEEQDDPAQPYAKQSPSFLEFLFSQKIALNLIFVLLFIAGIYATYTRTIENIPPVDMGEVIITTYFPGASAKDVENLVTVRLENIVQGFDHVKTIRSQSFRNVSSVTVSFSEHSDFRDLYSRLRTRVLNNKNTFPAGCRDPEFLFIDSQWLGALIRIDLYGEASETTRKWLAEKLKTQITAIEGIQSVDISGEAKNEFLVSLSPQRLQELGLTFSHVARAIKDAGTNISAGNLGGDTSEFILDAGHRFESRKDVLDVIIRRNDDGSFIRVQDVMVQAKTIPSEPTRLASYNGHDSVSLMVRKDKMASAVDLIKKIRPIVHAFEAKHNADGIRMALSSDSTREISQASGALRANMVVGLVLIAGVLVLTIGRRKTIFAALIIPFTLMTALIAMKLLGMSVNSINLVAMILIAGFVMDLSIMVLDTIARHQNEGKAIHKAALDGAAEVYRPLTGTILIIVITFLPLYLIPGPTGALFAVIPATIILILAATILGNLGFMPAHVYQWGAIYKRLDSLEWIFSNIQNRYETILTACLSHPIKIILAAVSLIVLTSAIILASLSNQVSLINITPFPNQVLRYHITMALPASSSIFNTNQAIRDLSEFILSDEGIKPVSMAGTAGFHEGEDDSILSGNQYGQIIMTLPHKTTGKNQLKTIDLIRTRLAGFIEKAYPNKDERPKISVFAEQNRLLSEKPLTVRVSGQSLERELDVSTKIIDFLNKQTSDGVAIGDGRTPEVSVVKYIPIQEKAYEKNISPAQITEFISGALTGIKVARFKAASEEIDLNVRIDSDVKAPRDLLRLPIGNRDGAQMFLRDVIKVETITELDSRGRYNGKPTVTFTADVRPGSNLTKSDIASLVTEYYRSIAEAFPDVTLSVEENTVTAKSMTAFIVAVIIALLAIYLILSMCLKNYVLPLIILFAPGCAMAVLTLIMLVTRLTFSVWGLMAFAGLCFVLINNALFLVHIINTQVSKGLSPREATLSACRMRMHPMLVSAVALTLGFLPMAIGLPSGSIPWTSMALVMAAGLLPSMILILFILPVACDTYLGR